MRRPLVPGDLVTGLPAGLPFRDVRVSEEWHTFPSGKRERLAVGTCVACGVEKFARLGSFRRGAVACTACTRHAITDVNPETKIGTCSACGRGVRVYLRGDGTWGCARASAARKHAYREAGRCAACGRSSGGKLYCPACRARRAARARNAQDRADGSITGPALAALFEACGWRCQCCGQTIDPTLPPSHPRSLAWDHVVPLSLGGAHSIANLAPTHRACNGAKSARTEDEAIDLFMDVEAFPEVAGRVTHS